MIRMIDAKRAHERARELEEYAHRRASIALWLKTLVIYRWSVVNGAIF